MASQPSGRPPAALAPLVNAEVGLLLAAMRSNNRWSLGSRQNRDSSAEPALVRNLKRVRDVLSGETAATDIEPLSYLKAFLDIIRSDQTSGPITLAALNSVYKFLTTGVISPADPHIVDTMAAVCDSVARCRFEGTDASADEVVLLRIVQTLQAAVQCSAGKFLTDTVVIECVQSIYRINRSSRFSELLRKSAEFALVEIMKTVFGRLEDLVEEKERHAMEPSIDAPDILVEYPESSSRLLRSILERSESFNVSVAVAQGPAASPKGDPEAKADAAPASEGPDGRPEAPSPSPPPAPPPTPAGDGAEAAALASPPPARGSPPPTRGSPPPDPSSPLPPRASPPPPALKPHAATPVPTSGMDRVTPLPHSQSSPAIADAAQRGPARAPPAEEAGAAKGPYGLACIAEIFRFLVSCCGGGEAAGAALQPEDLRILGLQLVNVALEAAGPAVVRAERLLDLMHNELPRAVIQNTRTESNGLLAAALRAFLNLVATARTELKLQIEFFVGQVYLRLFDNRFVTYEQQELVLESLVDFCRDLDVLPDVYVSYDCDLQRSNLFEALAKFLAKNAFPVSGPLQTVHGQCFDGMLAVLAHLAAHAAAASVLPTRAPSFALGSPASPAGDDSTQPLAMLRRQLSGGPPQTGEALYRQKQLKRKFGACADAFNRDPKKGLELLASSGLIPDPPTPEAVAAFLRFTPGLQKRLVGDYLGENEPFVLAVLAAFARSFDFAGEKLDEALRLYLEAFRLPGEAQKIDRVVQAFADRYFDQNAHTAIYANADVCYTLTFSLIMLNTDQHNKTIKKKMTVEDFVKNNRGINGNSDVPKEILEEMYRSISTNEIKLSDEQAAGEALTTARWLETIKKSRSAGALAGPPPGPPIHLREMFLLVWAPSLNALSVVFDVSGETATLEKCVTGFHRLASLAGRLRSAEALDALVATLVRFTGLLSSDGHDNKAALRAFGRNAKAQAACGALFRVARDNGDYLCEGWRAVVDLVVRLRKLDALPVFLEMDDLLDAESKAREEAQEKQRAAEAAAAAAAAKAASASLWSYIGLQSEPAVEEPTEEELEAERRAREFAAACRVDELFAETKFLQADSLTFLVKALILAALRSGAPQPAADGAQADRGPSPAPELPQPDIEPDTGIFCLELLVELTLRNRDRITLLWPFVHDFVSGVIASQQQPSPLLQRAVVGILRVCARMLHKEEVMEDMQRSLVLVASLEGPRGAALADRIAFGVLQVVKANAPYLASTGACWGVLLSLVGAQATRAPPSAASSHAFEALQLLLLADAQGVAPVAPPSLAALAPCLSAICAFVASPVGGVARSLAALDLLAALHAAVSAPAPAPAPAAPASPPASSSLRSLAAPVNPEDIPDASQEYEDVWLAVLQAIAGACADPRAEVRDHSVSLLQRALLAADVDATRRLSAAAWRHCFDRALFPSVSSLLQAWDDARARKIPPHLPKDAAAAAAAEEARARSVLERTLNRSAQLICKSFLQHLHRVAGLSDFHVLWLSLLHFLERLVRAGSTGKEGLLAEAVPEQTKNILLVMMSSYLLVYPPSTSVQHRLWEITWPALAGFCPHLKLELFPGSDAAPPGPSGSPQPATQAVS